MLFLLDANVLIDANRDYYPIDRVPEFWHWLKHQAERGRIKVPLEIYDEVNVGDDLMVSWLKEPETRACLILAEEATPEAVSRAVNEGYASDLRDDELLRVGNDPFLVAYAMAASSERAVVTTEVSRPSKQRANRKLPDVCKSFGIKSYNTFQLTRLLDFSTNWDRA